MFSSLRVREFRLFWFSMLLSLTGGWVQSIAQSWLVFKLTHSPFLLGLVGFLSLFPVSIFSLPAGVLIDRVVKRNLLIVTQSIFTILAFLLAVLVQRGHIRVWHIMAIAVANGFVLCLDAPARQAMVVELVGKQHLFNAIALNSAAFNSARMIGPALAGLLIAFMGMAGCFYVNAFSFLPVLAALLLIKPKAPVLNNKSYSFAQDIRQAVSFIYNNKFLFSLLCLVGAVSLFGIAYIILMPIFASDILGSGSRGLAILMSANGIGALIGALNLARTREAALKLRILKVSLVIFFLSVILFSFSKSLILSAFLLIFAGYGSSTSMSIVNTLLQFIVPDEFRGRVMAIFVLMFVGLVPFGNLFAGSLAYFFGAQITVSLSAIFCVLIFIVLDKKFLKLDVKKVAVV